MGTIIYCMMPALSINKSPSPGPHSDPRLLTSVSLASCSACSECRSKKKVCGVNTAGPVQRRLGLIGVESSRQALISQYEKSHMAGTEVLRRSLRVAAQKNSGLRVCHKWGSLPDVGAFATPAEFK